MRIMTRGRYDFFLGLAVLSSIAAFLWLRLDAVIVVYALWFWCVGAAVIFLWNSRTLMGRIIAVILIPAVLFQLCLPRKLRKAVDALPSEPS